MGAFWHGCWRSESRFSCLCSTTYELKLKLFPPQSPKHWDHGHPPPVLAVSWFSYRLSSAQDTVPIGIPTLIMFSSKAVFQQVLLTFTWASLAPVRLSLSPFVSEFCNSCKHTFCYEIMWLISAALSLKHLKIQLHSKVYKIWTCLAASLLGHDPWYIADG